MVKKSTSKQFKYKTQQVVSPPQIIREIICHHKMWEVEYLELTFADVFYENLSELDICAVDGVHPKPG